MTVPAPVRWVLTALVAAILALSITSYARDDPPTPPPTTLRGYDISS